MKMNRIENRNNSISFLKEYIHKNNIKHINLYLDSLNHFIRSFVVSYGTLQDSTGREISGLYTSIKSLLSIVKILSYDIGVDTNNITIYSAMEQGRSKKFKSIMKEYKENRPKPSIATLADIERNEAFKYNIQEFETFLSLLFPDLILFHINNIEGDFLLAYIYYKYMNESDLNIIISTDKDFYQLMSNPNTLVFDPLSNQIVHTGNFNNKLKIEKIPINIEDLPLFKTLTGDKSDNIKGVTGKITAAKVINILKETSPNHKIGDINDFWVLLNNYLDTNKKKHLKVFDKIVESKDNFNTAYTIMNLEKENVLKMLSTTNILDITAVMNKPNTITEEERIENMKKLSKFFEDHSFDYDLLLTTKRYILHNNNTPKMFGWNG